uniref:Transcription termination factor 2 n=1 Tax=Cuerna arida TaxID=1464854 RepID=A0A1B6EVV9_9HEMI
METSFNAWRKTETDSADSESDSDIVDDSTSETDHDIVISDSDESLSPMVVKAGAKEKTKEKLNDIIVPDSDEDDIIVPNSDEDDSISYLSLSLAAAKESKRRDSSTSKQSRRSSINKVVSSDKSNSSSPITLQSKRGKQRILDSEDESLSEDTGEDYNIRSSSSFKNEDVYSSTRVAETAESSFTDTDTTNTSKSDSIHLSKICNNTSNNLKKHSSPVVDLTALPNESKSNYSYSKRCDTGSSVSRKAQNIPSIDLTLIDDNKPGKKGYRDVIKLDKSDDENSSSDDKIVINNSDSEEDKFSENNKSKDNKSPIDLTKLHSMKISQTVDKIQPKFKKPPPQNTYQKGITSNDYSSRIESLKAEEMKLKMQVSEILKSIDTVKTTLKTAVLSALPDKGVRLQMHLKGLETKLRDLRYQQSTLANEILKSQFSGTSSQQQPPKPPPGHKIFSLPTTNTDLNALGKKAMETHRIQQSLTLDSLRVLHKSLENCPTEDTIVTDPKGLLVELLPHQKHGLAWLLWREKEKPSGGILADDMGLGKTLTMIALILKSNEENGDDKEKDKSDDSESDEEDSNWLSKNRKTMIEGKTLVVCPASLLGQWDGEIRSKLRRGMLDVEVHHGPNREKKARRLAAPDVVVTTYTIIARDAENAQSPLFQIRWRRIILDEAHQIRNAKTQTAKGVFQLKAKSRWALTGTPIHNKELDLQALLRFIRCKPFDDITVWKKWVDNRNSAGLQRLNTITKTLMLRRTKEGLQEKGELKSLTEKKFDTIFINLDGDEQEAYEKILNFSKELFSQFLHQKALKENALTGVAVSSKPSRYLQNAENPFETHPELARLHKQLKEINDVKSTDILVLLLRLRQFCCHPALVKKMLAKDEVSNAGIEDGDGLDLDMMEKLTRLSLNLGENQTVEDNKGTEKAVDVLSQNNPLYDDNRLSSKMRTVVKKLDEILQSQDKILVVSQWVSLLDLIHGVLQAKKVKCVMLTGLVPVKDRPAIVDKFNRKGDGPRVMLLSLTAGGVGLNLVGGNHLLLLDLHWNPQLESQAFDRIYRVGQEKNVFIYKFVMSETIEERILNLQKKKLEIANNVLTGAKHTSKLSLDDLKMLFEIS